MPVSDGATITYTDERSQMAFHNEMDISGCYGEGPVGVGKTPAFPRCFERLVNCCSSG